VADKGNQRAKVKNVKAIKQMVAIILNILFSLGSLRLSEGKWPGSLFFSSKMISINWVTMKAAIIMATDLTSIPADSKV
jgi:hypothetical protein